MLTKEPLVTHVYARSFVGNGRVTAQLAEDRKEASTSFEKRLAPQLLAIPDARVSFRSQFGWGSSGRDLTITLGGEDNLARALRRQAAARGESRAGSRQ